MAGRGTGCEPGAAHHHRQRRGESDDAVGVRMERCVRGPTAAGEDRGQSALTASKYGRDYFEATGKRTTNLASTNSTKVGAFPIPLPPLPEQEQIAAFLDASCATIDAAVAAKSCQLKVLDVLRRSTIKRSIEWPKSVRAYAAYQRSLDPRDTGALEIGSGKRCLGFFQHNASSA